jgi:hypothetical protein
MGMKSYRRVRGLNLSENDKRARLSWGYAHRNMDWVGLYLVMRLASVSIILREEFGFETRIKQNIPLQLTVHYQSHHECKMLFFAVHASYTNYNTFS